MTTIERLHQNGILRLGSPKKGFRYKYADGRKVSAKDLKRIKQLTIPPAWEAVAINAAPHGRVQVVGSDAAGRWQYLYDEKYVQSQDRRKFQRLIKFGESLPSLRKTISRNLGGSSLTRARVMACISRILLTSFMRPGSEIYASENGSYGIATVRPRHVKVKGDRITFDFPGKSGVQQQREIHDRAVARILRKLLRHPNRRVFKYESEDGKSIDVTGKAINDHIKEVMGYRFSAKDFRTWAGTLVCACLLAQESEESRGKTINAERKIKGAIKITSEVLGNTPAVCRKAYVCPAVLSSFKRGVVIHCGAKSLADVTGYRGRSLHPSERGLLRLLKKSIGNSQ